MSKRLKQKNRNETEYLRGEIKHLKSINRQLKKRLKELEKKEHFTSELFNGVIEATNGDVDLDICDECGKGEKHIWDIGFVKFSICNICNDRKKL